MKFYYNGQLIRTSKTHHYTHACISIKDGKIVCQGCSSTRVGAEKVKNDAVTRIENAVFSYRARIEAMKAGKNGYYNRRHEWISLKSLGKWTVEDVEGFLESDLATLERIKKEWIIVEIEERA